VTDTISRGNGLSGYQVVGDATWVELRSCTAEDNASGFRIDAGAGPSTVGDCEARDNRGPGFDVWRRGSRLVNCLATNNGQAGYLLGPTAGETRLERCVSSFNSQSASPEPEIDVHAPAVDLVDAVVDIGPPPAQANFGLLIRSGGSARVLGCTVNGVPGVSAVADLNRR
jgi:hypothetical protein